MRRVVALVALISSPFLLSAEERRVTVKYRSSANVYLEGGTADGLAVGDHLKVVSRGEVIGEVEVVFVSEHSASCQLVSEKRPVAAGDVAVVPDRAAPAEQASAGPAKEPITESVATTPMRAPAASSIPWARARGGFAVGLYHLWDDTPSARDFEQRNLRADLSLWDIWGKPYQFNVRFRGRQDVRSAPPGFQDIPQNERRDRLYELSLRYEPKDGPFVWEAGRLGTSPTGIGYLDGVLAAYRPAPAFQLGGFFGNNPNIDGFGPPPGRKYGAFFRLSNGGTLAPGNYDGQVSYIREFSGSEISREYVSFQNRLAAGTRFTSFQWVDVDLNTGWREAVAPQKVQISNLSLSASYRVTSDLQASLSYDQRRNYWTQQPLGPLPEVLFDNFLHQGFRASLDLFRPSSIGVSASFGVRRDDKDSATSYSWGAGVRHPRLFGLFLSVDGSGFTNPFTDGYLVSARASKSLGRTQIDFGYGASFYTLKAAGQNPIPGLLPNRLNQWGRGSARVELPHRFYLQGEFEYDTGDDTKGPRVLGEAGYRF